MSCDTRPSLIARLGRRLGIPGLTGQAAFAGGGSSGPPAARSVGRRTRPVRKPGQAVGAGKDQAGEQADLLAASPSAGGQKRSRPARRRLELTGLFSARELQMMSIQLRLGAAAAARQIQMLASDTARGVGHDDPRPLDWAQADRQQYQFLAAQLAAGDKQQRGVDISKLKGRQLTELWAFARFEADRAERNIDHLTGGLSHLKAETANYLTERHRLEARFYGYLAGELEPRISPEMLDEYWQD